jgi:hypothetical protein
MIAKLTAALVAVFLCLQFAQAETRLTLGGFSKHMSDGDYNGFHRTVILSHNKVFGGYFTNSYHDDSFVVGRTFRTYSRGLEFNLHAGAVYGYRESGKCRKGAYDHSKKIICPMIAPEVVFYRIPLKPSLSWYGLDAVVFHVNLTLE